VLYSPAGPQESTDVAVLPAVHAADRAFPSANDKRADDGYGNGARGTGPDVGACNLRSPPCDGPYSSAESSALALPELLCSSVHINARLHG
jgi:hypothetical protein